MAKPKKEKPPKAPPAIRVNLIETDACIVLHADMGVEFMVPQGTDEIGRQQLNAAVVIGLVRLMSEQEGFAEGVLQWLQNKEVETKSGISLSPNAGGPLHGH